MDEVRDSRYFLLLFNNSTSKNSPTIFHLVHLSSDSNHFEPIIERSYPMAGSVSGMSGASVRSDKSEI